MNNAPGRQPTDVRDDADRADDTAAHDLPVVLSALHDGVLVIAPDGLVLEMNKAFSDQSGYDLADGPFRPPYPWWPTEAEDVESLNRVRNLDEQLDDGRHASAEVELRKLDRSPWFASISAARVPGTDPGTDVIVHTIRDLTRQKAARDRRLAAAQVSAALAEATELDSALATGRLGFELLFDGGSTIQLSVDEKPIVLSRGVVVEAESLPEAVREGLGGRPSVDTVSRRPGILLVPRSSRAHCRAWVQFGRPRTIGVDEMIVADLLAQAFAIAVDRIIDAQAAEDREANLQQAIDSHRLIGQAVGILVERHRILPSTAFEQLRTVSQHRNLKLRDLAQRIVEEGSEPQDA